MFHHQLLRFTPIPQQSAYFVKKANTPVEQHITEPRTDHQFSMKIQKQPSGQMTMCFTKIIELSEYLYF